jgi:hypothetical protein
MKRYGKKDESNTKKANPFAVINNVRDMCTQPVRKKLLMLTLATYANADGICYPSNKKLREATGISKRTIQRILPALAAEGEIDILAPGVGRDKKRVIQLTKYAGKGDTAMTRKGDTAMAHLNAPRSPMKSVLEHPAGTSNTEHPTQNTRKVRSTRRREQPTSAPVVFEGKEKTDQASQSQGANGLHDSSEIQTPTKKGGKKFSEQPAQNDESGYVLDGKFLTRDEANRLGTANPDLLVKFQPAVRHDGKIQIVQSR